MSRLRYAQVHTEAFADAEAGKKFEGALRALRGKEAEVLPHRIGGKDVSSGTVFVREDPSNPNETASRAGTASTDVVEIAVEGSRRAQASWASLPFEDRCAVLRNAIPEFRRLEVGLAATISLETGKTRAEAFAEVGEVIALIELYCDQIERNEGFRTRMRSPGKGVMTASLLRPNGVLGVVEHAAFPIALAVNHVVAALVTGNSVLLKSSQLTPRCAALVERTFADASLPAGLLQLVHGDDRVAFALAASRLDGFVFTGSADLGAKLGERFAMGPYRRPFIAEVGIQNAVVVCADADLELATLGIVRSAFGLAGQRRNACTRVIAERPVHDELLERICEAAEGLSFGDPLNASAFAGPVLDAAAVDRFLAAVQGAAAGATVATGGGRLDPDGYFLAPTVIADLEPGHPLTREEVGFPLLAVVAADDFDAALEEANASRFGLAAGIYSGSQDTVERFLREVQAGLVFANQEAGATTGVWPGVQTMSGWKASSTTGMGGLGPYYLHLYMREQSCTTSG